MTGNNRNLTMESTLFHAYAQTEFVQELQEKQFTIVWFPENLYLAILTQELIGQLIKRHYRNPFEKVPFFES